VAPAAETGRKKVGQTWTHIALEVKSRFALEMRVAPRNLEAALALVVSVAVACVGRLPLFLIDDHRPYPSALLQVFGRIQHRRRRQRRGRKRHPTLKPPPGLLVGVVRKVRDAQGHLKKVSRQALFGTRRQIEARIQELDIGHLINTSHLERFNGTVRGRQSRLTRRTRQMSHRSDLLQAALWIFRDLYNWVKVHGSLGGRTPAMARGVSDHLWSLWEYVCHPVHVSDLQRDIWAEERQAAQESALDRYFRKKVLPIS
jgi:hypothetical protein